AYFNSLEWLENNGYVGKKDTVARPSSATPKTEQPKFKPVEKIPARACVACKTEFIPPFENSTHCGYCYKLSKFDSTHKLFNSLKPIEHTSRLT
ncbi:hypothetical protein OFN20_28085, partial [Escherichia coli]|nr:hypothetical protein [Escherichia coli]